FRVADVVAEEAFEIGRVLAERELRVRASAMALEALRRYGGTTVFTGALFERWAERAATSAEVGTRERIQADRYLSEVHFSAGRFGQANNLLYPAFNLARELADADLLASFGLPVTVIRWPPNRSREAAELAETLWSILHENPNLSFRTASDIYQVVF